MILNYIQPIITPTIMSQAQPQIPSFC